MNNNSLPISIILIISALYTFTLSAGNLSEMQNIAPVDSTWTSGYYGESVHFADEFIEKYIFEGNFKNAYEHCISIIENENANYDKIDLYRNAAYIASRMGDYDKALYWGNKVKDSIEKQDDCHELKLYADVLNELSTYYSRTSDYDKAIELCDKSILIYKNLENQALFYGIALNNLSHYYYKKGNIKEALSLCELALPTINQNAPESIYYVNGLQNMARYKSRLGRYAEAIQLCDKAKSILLTILSTDHPDYAILLSDVATYWSRLGEYVKAKELEEQALKIRYDKLGDMHPNYALSLNRLAHYYYKLGDYRKAIALCSEGYSIQAQILPENHYDYIMNLNDLGKYYVAIDSLDKAINVGKYLKDLYKNNYSDATVDYANVISNLASYYAKNNDFEDAMELEKEVLDIRKNVLSETHPDYAKSMLRLALYHSKMKDLTTAIDYAEKAMAIQKASLDINHPDILESMSTLANLYFLIGNYETGEKYAKTATDICNNNLKKTFQFLTKQERNMYWSKNRKWYSNILPNFVNLSSSKTIRSLGYDSSILFKGILINSEIEFDRFLEEYGSADLLELYNAIRAMHIQLNKLYEKPIAERILDTDSIERRANELERQLMQESSEFGDYTRNLTITWQDVQNKLNDKDAAIEFVSFPLNSDSIMYMAYVLRKGMDTPALVKLFEEKDVTSLSNKELYSKSKLSKLIWEKLQSEMDGVENIYFAPDGVLHQIAIEYLPDYNNPGKQISDKFNLYRLSSTRQLVISKTISHSGNPVIYGGIQYDTSTETMMSEGRKYEMASTRGLKSRYNIADSLSTRSRKGYLKHSLSEAMTINKMFEANNQTPILIIGDEATEESFKNLSGKKNDIIHIATHGFYWDKDEAEYEASVNKRLLFMSQSTDNARGYAEDKALTRTGLLMAGANNALIGKEIPEGIDDGILTAQEIANLNLRDLDLVVLSACQTGMGDISGDGVFGLQRGFKKAGTQSLLMSLWDVDDEATQMLMTEFYKNYLLGMSKLKALITAQKTLRKTTQFKDPNYWAAFILLDGLN